MKLYHTKRALKTKMLLVLVIILSLCLVLGFGLVVWGFVRVFL